MNRLFLILQLLTASSVLAQYGYTPTLPPAPPPPAPSSSYPSYPAYTDPYAYPGAGTQTTYGSPQNQGFGSIGTGGPNIINYNFLQANYDYLSPKNSALEGDHGVSMALSAQLFQPLFIKAEFGWAKSGGGGAVSREYDFTSVALGAGLYIPVAAKFHFLAEAGGIYGKLDANRDKLSFTDGALYLRPAVRFAPIEALELQAGVTVTSSDSFDSTIVDFSAFLRIFSQMDLGLGVDLGDEFTSFHGGIRFRW